MWTVARPAHPARHAALSLLVLGALACRPVENERVPSPRASSSVITPEQISTWNALNALDAVQRAGMLSVRYAADGQPRGVATRRGPSSLVLRDSDVPGVIVDGARAVDAAILRDIPASAIASIELLGAADATTRYGTGLTAGAIVVRTRSGPR